MNRFMQQHRSGNAELCGQGGDQQQLACGDELPVGLAVRWMALFDAEAVPLQGLQQLVDRGGVGEGDVLQQQTRSAISCCRSVQ